MTAFEELRLAVAKDTDGKYPKPKWCTDPSRQKQFELLFTQTGIDNSKWKWSEQYQKWNLFHLKPQYRALESNEKVAQLNRNDSCEWSGFTWYDADNRQNAVMNGLYYAGKTDELPCSVDELFTVKTRLEKQ